MTWFQVLLTPLIAVLFTFQSLYLYTIGRRVVLSLGGWTPLLHAEFHELYATLGLLSTEGCRFRVRGCHPLCPTFPSRSANDAFVTPRGPATPRCKHHGLGYIRLRSPLLTESRLISFPPGTEMFQFPGFAPYGLYIHPQVMPSGCPVTPGFPIRRSPDRSLFDSSPRHIAACHVLHRLSTPRHPPCTLRSLTTFMRGCASSRLPTLEIPLPCAAAPRLSAKHLNRTDFGIRGFDTHKSLAFRPTTPSTGKPALAASVKDLRPLLQLSKSRPAMLRPRTGLASGAT